ncbi:MAG: serine--tRNA ligase [Bacteroidetes bacterium]|nr:MAG: serine--tRNA ligase [Bacteroidota bacterium]RLD72802.1 MAG: serine--tRNA ligase [Bacteroidota bacterium]RLD95208.1 MAG: serine--tRNA ligase [Bacteroidota bacterium]
MLTIPYIRDNRETILKRLEIKNFRNPELIDQIIALDNERRSLQVKTNEQQAEMNRLSKEIGMLFKSGEQEKANQVKKQTTSIKQELETLEQNLQISNSKVNELLVQVPNVPHPSVPAGKSEADNKEIRLGGDIPQLAAGSLPHWELAKKYNLIDFELGVKITGAGFPVYRGQGARLQRALIAWFLDENTRAGYEEILPPLMVNEASAFGTGNLPDKEGQMYHVTGDNLYMIPTAEIPVTNIYRDVILNAEDLPVKNTAYTPCFRREAGSYGKDVRGLNRVHQFDKVEIVQIEHPTRSYQALEEMVSHVEQLIVKLGLPYRIVELCGGDLSFTSALTYDFEVYSAAQEKWLEVSSVSNFESFQTNRLKLRFREPGEKRPLLAHTLNGSSLALPRIMAALLENFQTPEGIIIPEVLHPYMGPGNTMIS